MNENLFAYGIGTHRHMPEMEQIAGEIAGCDARILFQPHAGPFDRGILSTVYCQPEEEAGTEQLAELYSDFYAAEPFVYVVNACPGVKDVWGTNYCHIFPIVVKGRIVIFSAIDNLGKGASGQAVQNMNIIFGLDETLGLV
jgi:N-acetyl-gamma-glutamyl-phosphate reductase